MRKELKMLSQKKENHFIMRLSEHQIYDNCELLTLLIADCL